MKLLIVGCGYVGRAVLKFAPPDSTILALTRSAERAKELEAWGAQPIVGDWLEPQSLELPEVDRVLVSVPHREVEPHGNQSHVKGLSNLIDALPAGWSKLLYLSTTGVYGQATGVVDESTPVSPTRVGPAIAVEAEQWLVQQYGAEQSAILRLAGIYGPDRIPLAQRLKTGQPLEVSQQGHVNLVHVHDIARMIHQVLHRQLAHSIYVFSDGRPVLRKEFYRYMADCCGISEPKFSTPDPDSSRAARATDKQINPQRLVEELDFQFEYPDYQAGLRHALG